MPVPLPLVTAPTALAGCRVRLADPAVWGRGDLADPGAVPPLGVEFVLAVELVPGGRYTEYALWLPLLATMARAGVVGEVAPARPLDRLFPVALPNVTFPGHALPFRCHPLWLVACDDAAAAAPACTCSGRQLLWGPCVCPAAAASAGRGCL